MAVARQILIQELLDQHSFREAAADILVAVHGQPGVLALCLTSVRQHTTNFRLLVWDNASGPRTRAAIDAARPDVLVRSEVNLGFGPACNRLAALGRSPYLIVLNSDVPDSPGWREALLGHLQARPTALVGFQGGRLSAGGVGSGDVRGADPDYLWGWCLAMSRETYLRHGLFDPEYRPAYCEDADLSLRLRAAGEGIYALHLDLARHWGGRSARPLLGDPGFLEAVRRNHRRLVGKWPAFFGESIGA